MKWFPVNWGKLRLINKRNGDSSPTTLTELIKEKGYGECEEIFSGKHPLYEVKGVRDARR